jgi:imidazolonepropionase-like amidohydrolase
VTTLLTGAVLVDGTGSDPATGLAVAVDGEHITAVDTIAPGRDTDVVDLSGLTLLPGLIDAHVHFGYCSDMEGVLHGKLSIAERAADMFRTVREALEAGFTAARDCGGIDLGLIRTVRRGLIPGPRIWASASPLSQTGGHGRLGSPFSPAGPTPHSVRGLTAMTSSADGPDEIRRAARECFRQGATFLKMNVTGGVVSVSDSLADTQYTVEEIAVAVAEARARNTYVTVHAHNVAGIRNAVMGGVGCVEHGTGIDEPTAQLMADRGTHLVPTLSIAEAMTTDFEQFGLPPEIRDRVGDSARKMVDGMLAARAVGVLVGSGSDLIGPRQGGRGMEIGLKARAIGAMAAIVSATSVNARIMRVADQIGSIEAGKLADVIAVDFDPLAAPELFAEPDRVVFVMKGGTVVKDTRK